MKKDEPWKITLAQDVLGEKGRKLPYRNDPVPPMTPEEFSNLLEFCGFRLFEKGQKIPKKLRKYAVRDEARNHYRLYGCKWEYRFPDGRVTNPSQDTYLLMERYLMKRHGGGWDLHITYEAIYFVNYDLRETILLGCAHSFEREASSKAALILLRSIMVALKKDRPLMSVVTDLKLIKKVMQHLAPHPFVTTVRARWQSKFDASSLFLKAG